MESGAGDSQMGLASTMTTVTTVVFTVYRCTVVSIALVLTKRGNRQVVS